MRSSRPVPHAWRSPNRSISPPCTAAPALAVLVCGAVVACVAPVAPAAAWEFAPPQLVSDTVANSDLGDDSEPCVATDGAGNWVAVWESQDSLGGTIGTDSDILVARSDDDGATWSVPFALNDYASNDSWKDWMPYVATDGAGNWVAAWAAYEDLGGAIGSDGDILMSRSTDNGATWTTPAALNTNAGSDSGWDFEPRIATDSAGNWLAVWTSQDTAGGTIAEDRDLLIARSADAGVTWTAPVVLNSNAGVDAGEDERAEVATDGMGNWVAVWSSTDTLGGTIGTDSDILVAQSSDAGATWTSPVALNSNAGADISADHYPAVATDGAGNWLTVWGSTDDLGDTIGTDWDILVSRSTDAGATWSPAAALNANAGSDSGHDRSPVIATDAAGNWVVLWESDDSLGDTVETDDDILVAISSDVGATWSGPASVYSGATSDSAGDLDPRIVTDGNGSWRAVWTSSFDLDDLIGADADILTAESTDAGASWAIPQPLNANAAADKGPDQYPALATDGADNWVALWSSRSDLAGTIGHDRDILAASSFDGGQSWTFPIALNGNAAVDAQDDLYPDLATDGAGTWVAVWQSSDTLGDTISVDPDILVASSTDAGMTWSFPVALNTNAATDSGGDYQPSIATDGAGIWVVSWTSLDELEGTVGPDTDIFVARSTDDGATWTPVVALNSNAATDTGGDFASQVVTDADGNWLVVWESEDDLSGTIGTDADILAARSSDGGASWTDPYVLNTNAAVDTGNDQQPRLATDGLGHWVATWYSDEDLGGGIGTDEDIFTARSTDIGATWSAPSPLTAGPSTDSGDDYQPRVQTDGRGHWLAAWWGSNSLEYTIGIDWDILFARSADNGVTWTSPSAFNANAASDSGTDAAVAIAADASGRWVAVWESDDKLGGLASYGVSDIFGASTTICGSEPVEESQCLGALVAKLKIDDPSDPRKRRLAWQWKKGDAFDESDLGDPAADTDYELCVWDTTAAVPSLALALDIAASTQRWIDKGSKGRLYKDPDGVGNGVTVAKLVTGAQGRGHVVLNARRAELPLPGPVGSAYFDRDPAVTVQLHGEAGTCWTSRFSAADTVRNDASRFVAVAKQ
jgi:hypothetical protein